MGRVWLREGKNSCAKNSPCLVVNLGPRTAPGVGSTGGRDMRPPVACRSAKMRPPPTRKPHPASHTRAAVQEGDAAFRRLRPPSRRPLLGSGGRHPLRTGSGEAFSAAAEGAARARSQARGRTGGHRAVFGPPSAAPGNGSAAAHSYSVFFPSAATSPPIEALQGPRSVPPFSPTAAACLPPVCPPAALPLLHFPGSGVRPFNPPQCPPSPYLIPLRAPLRRPAAALPALLRVPCPPCARNPSQRAAMAGEGDDGGGNYPQSDPCFTAGYYPYFSGSSQAPGPGGMSPPPHGIPAFDPNNYGPASSSAAVGSGGPSAPANPYSGYFGAPPTPLGPYGAMSAPAHGFYQCPPIAGPQFGAQAIPARHSTSSMANWHGRPSASVAPIPMRQVHSSYGQCHALVIPTSTFIMFCNMYLLFHTCRRVRRG